MNLEVQFDISELVTIVMVVAVEVIGVVQWLKNFFNNDPAKSHRKRNAFIALFILIPCAMMQTVLVPPLFTTIFNIIFLALAVEQLAYETIVKGIPTLVNSLFDKAASFTAKKDSYTEQ